MTNQRNAWSRYDATLMRHVADDERAALEFGQTTVDEHGVVRWAINGSVPPVDCLEQWARIGMMFDLAASKDARIEEVRRSVAKYREDRMARGYSHEEIAEMRAAFGPGEEVVNVITGQRIRL